MDTNTILIGMMSIMGAMLIFIIITFLVIQRKNKKSEKTALRKSLEATNGRKRFG